VVPQAAKGIPLGVDGTGSSGFSRIIRGVEQSPLFHGEEKEEAVNKAQELLEIGVIGEFARFDASAKRIIAGRLQKPTSQSKQRVLHADAKPGADSLALSLAFEFSPLPHAGVA